MIIMVVISDPESGETASTVEMGEAICQALPTRENYRAILLKDRIDSCPVGTINVKKWRWKDERNSGYSLRDCRGAGIPETT
jgi:hypothetical protein